MTKHPEGERVEITPELLARVSKASEEAAVPFATFEGSADLYLYIQTRGIPCVSP